MNFSPLLRRAGTYRTFYDEPLQVVSAHGCTILDDQGVEYLDAYNNVPVLGHSHPGVADTVTAQLLRANTHTKYRDRTVDDYTRDLLSLLPQHIASAVFTTSGSEANDLALQVAAYTSMATGVIVTGNAYHGTTAATAAISPSLNPRAQHSHVVRVDVPSAEDPEFEQVVAKRVKAAAEELERRGHGLSAFVLDSTLTSDGIVCGPHVRLPAVVDAVHDAGGLYIADEVQSGFFRTGTWWGFEHLGVAPDLISFGKPMGGGMPVAAVAGPRVVFDDFGAHQRYFSTFAGTPAPLAAAHVVLNTLREGRFGDRVEQAGRRLGDGLQNALQKEGIPARVRRAGMMLGVDLQEVDASGELAQACVREMHARRVLIGSTGANGAVLKIRPPLVITDQEIETIIAEFTAMLAQLVARRILVL